MMESDVEILLLCVLYSQLILIVFWQMKKNRSKEIKTDQNLIKATIALFAAKSHSRYAASVACCEAGFFVMSQCLSEEGSPNNAHVIETICSEISCTIHYPDENPDFALRDITTALSSIGVLSDLK